MTPDTVDAATVLIAAICGFIAGTQFNALASRQRHRNELVAMERKYLDAMQQSEREWSHILSVASGQ